MHETLQHADTVLLLREASTVLLLREASCVSLILRDSAQTHFVFSAASHCSESSSTQSVTGNHIKVDDVCAAGRQSGGDML